MFIRDINGKIKSFPVYKNFSETILQIKSWLFHKCRIVIEDQLLTYGSKTLSDNLKLSDYNINEDATLHLTIRILGGCSCGKKGCNECKKRSSTVCIIINFLSIYFIFYSFYIIFNYFIFYF